MYNKICQTRLFVKSLELENDGIYTGEVSENGKPYGQGVIVYNDGSYRQGQYQEGAFLGWGIEVQPNGVICGFWINGKVSGYAKAIKRSKPLAKYE